MTHEEALREARRQALMDAMAEVEAYAAEKEAEAPYEDTEDYRTRMLVYAKHVRRAGKRIARLLKEESET